MITLDGETLTIEDVVSVARAGTRVKLSPKAKEKIETAADLVKKWTDSGEIIYGVTTGFGPFSEVVVSNKKARQLQRNLIISHATGVGSPLPVEVVRAAMLLRANTLAKGCSGIQLSTVQLLVDLLNKEVHPIIPEKGSVGASGDLAPLSHLALVLIGEGEAVYNGVRLSGADALKRAGLKPITLESKEGIALINGTQIMTAIATLAIADAKTLVASAEIAAALSIEALEGVLDAYDSRIHKVRPHVGQRTSASNLVLLLTHSSQVMTSRKRAELAEKAAKHFHEIISKNSINEQDSLKSILSEAIHTIVAIDQQIPVEPPGSAKLLKAKRNRIKKHFEELGITSEAIDATLEMVRRTRRVQDAYSLRCTPQVLGATRDAISYIEQVISIEINAATDNPLIFPKTNAFLSGGNFHGQPIAIAMDLLAISLSSVGSIAERRIARLIDDKLSNGLPLLLIHPALADQGVHYGLGLAHITAAALTAECQTLSTPASIKSIPTSANQEDHVSMGLISARQAREVISNVEHIIAIELLCAVQGIDIRRFQKAVTLGHGSQIAYDMIRRIIPRHIKQKGVSTDRLVHDVLIHQDIDKLWHLVHTGKIIEPVCGQFSDFRL